MRLLTTATAFATTVGMAQAANIGVEATKLIVVDKLSSADKAKTVFVAKDQAITKGVGLDQAGIEVRFEAGYDGASTLGRFDLPLGDSGWLANKETVAKFVNKDAPGGTTQAKVAVIKPGKLLKLVGKGLGDDDFDILAAGSPPGGVWSRYCVTNDGSEYCHCSEFAECVWKPIAGGSGAKLVCKGGAADPDCAGLSAGPHLCEFDSGSQMTVTTSLFQFPAITMSGAIEIDCGDGTLDASQTAPCTCQLQVIDPIDALGGTICFEPAAISCAAGKIDCDGGDELAWDTVSHHNIGSCTSNADCAVMCGAYCPIYVGAGYANVGSGCEQFCQGGVNDGAPCTNDAECLPGGTCNGPEGGLHDEVCQCQCGKRVPPASSAGDMLCQLPVKMKVVALGAPCTDPATSELPPLCVPLSTEAASGVILHANNDPLSSSFGDSGAGLPLACNDLFSNGITTAGELAGTAAFFDSSIFGDFSVLFEAGCL